MQLLISSVISDETRPPKFIPQFRSLSLSLSLLPISPRFAFSHFSYLSASINGLASYFLKVCSIHNRRASKSSTNSLDHDTFKQISDKIASFNPIHQVCLGLETLGTWKTPCINKHNHRAYNTK